MAKKTHSVSTADKDAVGDASLVRPLVTYHHGGFTNAGLNFARLYHPKGDGPRESIMGLVNKKLVPAGSGAKACRARSILPPDAPDLLEDPRTLAGFYEANLPSAEPTVCAVLTFPLPHAVNAQGSFQLVSHWLFSEFALEHQVAAVAVFHAPELEGSRAAPHAHALILTGLRVGRFGWSANEASLACDDAAEAAKKSWGEFAKTHSLA